VNHGSSPWYSFSRFWVISSFRMAETTFPSTLPLTPLHHYPHKGGPSAKTPLSCTKADRDDTISCISTRRSASESVPPADLIASSRDVPDDTFVSTTGMASFAILPLSTAERAPTISADVRREVSAPSRLISFMVASSVRATSAVESQPVLPPRREGPCQSRRSGVRLQGQGRVPERNVPFSPRGEVGTWIPLPERGGDLHRKDVRLGVHPGSTREWAHVGSASTLHHPAGLLGDSLDGESSPPPHLLDGTGDLCSSPRNDDNAISLCCPHPFPEESGLRSGHPVGRQLVGMEDPPTPHFLHNPRARSPAYGRVGSLSRAGRQNLGGALHR